MSPLHFLRGSLDDYVSYTEKTLEGIQPSSCSETKVFLSTVIHYHFLYWRSNSNIMGGAQELIYKETEQLRLAIIDKIFNDKNLMFELIIDASIVK